MFFLKDNYTMTSHRLYEVYCIEEAAIRRVTGFTEPTQCPLVHNDRSIDANQTVLIDSIPIVGNNVEFLTPKLEQIASTKFIDVKTSFYFDPAKMETLTDIKVVSWLDKKSANGTYDIRVFDVTHAAELGTINLSNETLTATSIGALDNLPTTDAIIEFHAKTSQKNDKAHLKSVAVYYKSN